MHLGFPSTSLGASILSLFLTHPPPSFISSRFGPRPSSHFVHHLQEILIKYDFSYLHVSGNQLFSAPQRACFSATQSYVPRHLLHLCVAAIRHQRVQDQVHDLSQKICSSSFVLYLSEWHCNLSCAYHSLAHSPLLIYCQDLLYPSK